MLNVKNVALLSKKLKKKGENFDHGCTKKSSSARFFFCNLVSRFGLILVKILFSIEWK